MDAEQMFFAEFIVEADERNRAAQDELRLDVQQWFDQLPPPQKDALGLWLSGTTQYDTHVALAAAAGDWHRTRQKELVNEWNNLHRAGSGNGAARTREVRPH